MRKISWQAALTVAATGLSVLYGQPAAANDVNYISQNIQGFNLPGVQLPQGADEVRAADGTTCRSAVSGSGAYLDVGVIGTPGSSSTTGTSTASAYGRIVIPLGHQPKRLDCSELYALEVERLKMELRLMQMGLGNQGQPAEMSPATMAGADEPDTSVKTASTSRTGRSKRARPSQSGGSSWADEGWTTEGKD